MAGYEHKENSGSLFRNDRRKRKLTLITRELVS